MTKLNLRSSLVALSMVAIAALPAISSAHTDASADVSAKAGIHADFARWGKGIKHFAAKAIEGTVSAVNGNGSFTVSTAGNTSVNLQTNSTTTVKNDGKAGTVADITAGTNVVAKGTWDSAHTVFTATKVAIVAKLNPIRGWFANLFASHVVNGKLTAVSGTTLTIQGDNGTVYTVSDASAKLYDKNFTVVAATDFKIGDRIQVLGTISGTSANADIVHDISLSK